MKGIVSFIFVFLVLLSCDSPKNRASFLSGRVTHIVDGDTYDVLLDGEQVRIRMEGIDAPERGQDYYKKSKEYLGELCMWQEVRVEGTKKDRWGRLIAKTYNQSNQELGELMIMAGMAWHFKEYSDDITLSKLETEAREAGLGLWSIDNPTPPWEKRKKRKS